VRLLTILGWAAVGAALTPLSDRASLVLPARGGHAAATASQHRLRRPLIALWLACAFGWLAWRHGLSPETFVVSVYAAIFVIIALIDLDHHLILNLVVAPAAVFALLAAFALPQMSLARALVGGATGFVLMLLPAAILPGGLGAGDVKLAGFLGLAAGFPAILTALASGIILGGVATLALLITRRIGRRDYVPYGPFLLLGAVLVLMQW